MMGDGARVGETWANQRPALCHVITLSQLDASSMGGGGTSADNCDVSLGRGGDEEQGRETWRCIRASVRACAELGRAECPGVAHWRASHAQ